MVREQRGEKNYSFNPCSKFYILNFAADLADGLLDEIADQIEEETAELNSAVEKIKTAL